MATTHDIVMMAGQTKTIGFTHQTKQGVAIDITGATFEAKVREGLVATSPTVLDFASRITITSGTDGQGEIAFTSSDSNQTNVDGTTWEQSGFTGIYDVLVYLADGTVEPLIGTSRFTIHRRQSRA